MKRTTHACPIRGLASSASALLAISGFASQAEAGLSTVERIECRFPPMAMHSRHEFAEFALPGFTSSPEQYYGSCSPDTGSPD